MALKLCPICKGTHRKRSAFLACVKRNKKETWKL